MIGKKRCKDSVVRKKSLIGILWSGIKIMYRDHRLRPHHQDQDRCRKLRGRRDCHCLVRNRPKRPDRPGTNRPEKCCKSSWPISFVCRVAPSENQIRNQRLIVTRPTSALIGDTAIMGSALQDYLVYFTGQRHVNYAFLRINLTLAWKREAPRF